MKKTSKFFAVLLTLAMVASFVPLVALADGTDPTFASATIKGQTVTLGTGGELPNELVNAAGELITSATGSVTLTTEQAESSLGFAFVRNDASTDPIVTIGKVTDSADLGANGANLFTLAGANAFTTGVVEDGDIFIIFSHSAADAGDIFYVIVATVADDAAGVAPQGSIDIETEVNNPVFNVILPLTIKFALDPMMLGNPDVANGNQISATDYRITNMSPFAVKASFAIEATKAGTVTIAEPGKAPLETVAAKSGYFGILGAASLAGTPTFADATIGTYTYNPATAGTLIPFDWTANVGEAGIEFMLGAATSGPDALAAANKGVASFNFYGELNTLAIWATTDLQMTGTYTLAGILPAPYTAAAAGTIGVNQLSGAALGFAGADPSVGTLTVARGASAEVDFNYGNNTMTEFVLRVNQFDALPLVSKTATGFSVAVPGTGWTAQVFTVDIKLSNGDTFVLTLTVT